MVSVGSGLAVSSWMGQRRSATYKIVVFRSVLLEQRIGGEIGGVTSSGEDDGTHLGVLYRSAELLAVKLLGSEIAHMLSLVLVVDTRNLVSVLDDLLDICLLKDLDSIRRVLGQVLELIISLDSCRPQE